MARVKEGGVYYGWVIVVVSMLAALVVSGARMSFGPSFKPMLADFDTNRGLLSLAMSLNQIFYGLAGPLMGWLTDRYGARTIILVGAVLTVAGVIGSSLSPNLWVLYVTYGLFAGFGFSGATAIPFSALITRWFHRKSGLALGLSAAGTPVGQTVLVPFSMFLILAFSWRFAYIVLGAMVALIILPLAWRFVKADPQDMGLLPDGESRSTAPSASPTAAGLGMSVNKSLAQAVRTRPYWLLCIGWFDCGFTGFLIATHFVPFATDIGMDPMRAASVFSLVGLFTIIGTFGAGAVSDRIGRKNPLTIVYLSKVLAFPLIMTPLVFNNHVFIYAFAIIFGLGQLASLPLTAALTREVYGQRSMGIILGTILLVHQIGAAVGVYLGGAIFDSTGSYYLAFLMALVFSLIATVATYMIKEEQRPAYAPRVAPAG